MSLEKIDRVNRKFEELTNAGDAEGLSQLYSKDAIVLPPDAAMVRGREAVAGLWRHVFDEMGLKKIELITRDLQIAGDEETAYEVGEAKLQLEKDGETMQATAKYAVVWIRIDGAWRLHRDIWNSSP